MGLSPEVKAVAHKLVHAPKTSMLQAIDCSKMDAYTLLKDAFSTLSANITAENATIYAHDAAVHLCLCFCVHLRHADLCLRRMPRMWAVAATVVWLAKA